MPNLGAAPHDWGFAKKKATLVPNSFTADKKGPVREVQNRVPEREKWGEASQAMLKSWRSLMRCELATYVCFVRAYTCVCICVCVCVCMCVRACVRV